MTFRTSRYNGFARKTPVVKSEVSVVRSVVNKPSAIVKSLSTKRQTIVNQPDFTPQEQEIIDAAEKEYAALKVSRNLVKKNGRPEKINGFIVLKLIGAFQSGMTVGIACQYAGIGRTAFYRHMNEDEDFRNIITDAQDWLKVTAGDRLKTIIQTGDERAAAPLIRWYLERAMPDTYGSIKPDPNNGPNNYFFINNGRFESITKQSGIENADPSQLLEAIEAEQNVDNGTEENGAASIHSQENGSEHTEEVDLSQSSSTI
jgi:hypothetical protein